MASHNELGKKGEDLAGEYLLDNGYRILARNYTYRKFEIDLIAQKGPVLAVIEVKTRSSITFGPPQHFVNQQKIAGMAKAINHFVQVNGVDLNIRFDVVGVVKKREGYTIEHIPDAFYFFG
jgi:putative endonuclease